MFLVPYIFFDRGDSKLYCNFSFYKCCTYQRWTQASDEGSHTDIREQVNMLLTSNEMLFVHQTSKSRLTYTLVLDYKPFQWSFHKLLWNICLIPISCGRVQMQVDCLHKNFSATDKSHPIDFPILPSSNSHDLFLNIFLQVYWVLESQTSPLSWRIICNVIF